MTEPRDDLPALDPRAAALLATYRRGRAMPPAARARVQARLSGTCPQEHVLPLMPRHRHGTAWAVALALAAAVLLWFGFARRGHDLAEQTGHSPTMSPAHGAAATAAADANPGAAAPADERAEAPAPVQPVSAAEPTPAAEPVRSRPKPADLRPTRDATERNDEPAATRDEPVAEEVPASDLRGEQELLARGWQSLASGDAGAAARDAGEHARRYPAGVLAPERRALEAAATCVDDPERGAELARAFLADHPRSPLARRVRDVCDLAP
ncbi:hypothetical protein [Nannocystis punicea]|uniref:Uncharacterized protein n=1 Tax=Nannocystis punicea TaxID=2995304 RepID=A0ABY7HIQ3_9BACT|nr:hypothetical protein [Nannocystis poenicansa]WAS99208.1 hypothetical protein O0S08_24025 [Nannocystis poenicansa]